MSMRPRMAIARGTCVLVLHMCHRDIGMQWPVPLAQLRNLVQDDFERRELWEGSGRGRLWMILVFSASLISLSGVRISPSSSQRMTFTPGPFFRTTDNQVAL